MTAISNHTGWQARLELELSHIDGRSRLLRRRHVGPLQVQRPFYPECDGTCHVYILHPPGGIVAGDRLDVEVKLNTHSSALLTTPAAGKVYRSTGRTALQQQGFSAGAQACLEWLPQENILYNGARLDAQTRIDLHASARCIVWEMVCLGRPAANERFQHGLSHQRLQIWRERRPLFLDRMQLQGGSEPLRADWGLAGQAVTAILLATPADAELVALLRHNLSADDTLGITQRDGVLLVRYLGPSTDQARRYLINTWRLLRPAVLNKTPCAPRIWNT